MMSSLSVQEIKAFVPARDYALSKRFYQDLGFELRSDGGGIAYFSYGACSFLLQDFYAKDHTDNFMMHLLVQDVDAWYAQVQASGVVAKYGVRCLAPEEQPWGMRDFVLYDPSGVLWRIGQNI